jgi:hypothetical protein
VDGIVCFMLELTPSQVVGMIAKTFPWTVLDEPSTPRTPPGGLQGQSVVSVAPILAAVDAIRPELITLEGDDVTTFVTAVSQLRSAVTTWQNQNTASVKLDGSPIFGGIHPLTVIARLLATCPNEIPSPTTLELPFVRDPPKLRESLRLDISACESALVNRSWKSCTVVAGSVVEALLLWAIQSNAAAIGDAVEAAHADKSLSNWCTGDNLDRWHIHDFAAVALKLGLIERNTHNQIALVRHYRNLIHAGAVQRVDQQCDRSTALAALSAIEAVTRDLGKRFS